MDVGIQYNGESRPKRTQCKLFQTNGRKMEIQCLMVLNKKRHFKKTALAFASHQQLIFSNNAHEKNDKSHTKGGKRILGTH